MVNCPNCRKVFIPNRTWQQYCSNKCRTQAWMRNHPRIDLTNEKESRIGFKPPEIDPEIKLILDSVKRKRNLK